MRYIGLGKAYSVAQAMVDSSTWVTSKIVISIVDNGFFSGLMVETLRSAKIATASSPSRDSDLFIWYYLGITWYDSHNLSQGAFVLLCWSTLKSNFGKDPDVFLYPVLDILSAELNMKPPLNRPLASALVPRVALPIPLRRIRWAIIKTACPAQAPWHENECMQISIRSRTHCGSFQGGIAKTFLDIYTSCLLCAYWVFDIAGNTANHSIGDLDYLFPNQFPWGHANCAYFSLGIYHRILTPTRTQYSSDATDLPQYEGKYSRYRCFNGSYWRNRFWIFLGLCKSTS